MDKTSRSGHALTAKSFALTAIAMCLLLAPAFGKSTVADVPKKIRVALFVDHGARARDALKEKLSQQSDMQITEVFGEDIRQGALDRFDVIFFPGGSGRTEALSLADEGRDEVRRFVSNGGNYIGVCAGCYLLSKTRPEYLNLLPVKTADGKHWRRGKGMLPVELTPLGQEVFGTKDTKEMVLYHNGPVLSAINEQSEDSFRVLSYFRGEYVAPNGQPGVMVDSPAMILGQFGKGLVIGISPHPEATEATVFMEPNAIRWLCAQAKK